MIEQFVKHHISASPQNNQFVIIETDEKLESMYGTTGSQEMYIDGKSSIKGIMQGIGFKEGTIFVHDCPPRLFEELKRDLPKGIKCYLTLA